MRDRVKGSIHRAGGKSEWQPITGEAKVLDARTLLFEDGTRISYYFGFNFAPADSRNAMSFGSPCGLPFE